MWSAENHLLSAAISPNIRRLETLTSHNSKKGLLSLSIFPFPKQEEDHKKNRLGFHSNSNNLLSTYKSRCMLHSV
ncbi:hypothetical protein AAC387_Pa04g0602 [Persea americana]